MSDKESAPASRDARPAVHPAAPGPHTAAGQRTTADQRTGAVHPAGPLVAIGITCGIAWAAGFRSYMVELVGPASTFSWGEPSARSSCPGPLLAVSWAGRKHSGGQAAGADGAGLPSRRSR
jgi:hypothetical protein